jgi:hypothetical protein
LKHYPPPSIIPKILLLSNNINKLNLIIFLNNVALFLQCNSQNSIRKGKSRMKKTILLVALFTMVAFVSGVMAQQKPAAAPAKAAGTAAPAPAPAKAPATEKAAKVEKFAGMVEKVDEAAKAVVVKGKKDEKTFVINDKTTIMKGGKDMPLTDLKKGMNVSLEYKKDGDKMVAVAIKAAAPKAAPKEKKEAPAAKPAEAPKK